MRTISKWNSSAPRLLVLLGVVAFVPTSWLFSPSRGLKPSIRPVSPAVPFESSGDPDRGNWPSFAALHAMYVDRFVKSEGFGLSRMPSTAELQTLIVNGRPHRTRRIELISLDSGPQPFAYVTKYGNPTMKQLAATETRDLTSFELDAVQAVRSGQDVVFNGDPEQPAVVGAIRATDSCLNCHLAKRGQLLGCMAYELLPVSQPARLGQLVP